MEKFLVVIEGELYKIIEEKDDLDKYLIEYANILRKRGCEDVDRWECEMRTFYYSQVYNNYPDFVLPICKDYFENSTNFIDFLK